MERDPEYLQVLDELAEVEKEVEQMNVATNLKLRMDFNNKPLEASIISSLIHNDEIKIFINFISEENLVLEGWNLCLNLQRQDKFVGTDVNKTETIYFPLEKIVSKSRISRSHHLQDLFKNPLIAEVYLMREFTQQDDRVAVQIPLVTQLLSSWDCLSPAVNSSLPYILPDFNYSKCLEVPYNFFHSLLGKDPTKADLKEMILPAGSEQLNRIFSYFKGELLMLSVTTVDATELKIKISSSVEEYVEELFETLKLKFSVMLSQCEYVRKRAPVVPLEDLNQLWQHLLSLYEY